MGRVVSGFLALMDRGGPVMWPLLGLSVVALTLGLERGWFFFVTNRGGRVDRAARLAGLLRAGQHDAARQLAATDGGLYGDVVLRLLSEPVTEAAALDAVESQRRRLERFMPTLSTIITAAPMLGILGTVFGIIGAFDLLSAEGRRIDPALVSGEIAEALITTAAGLIVALLALFPFNTFRAQIDRTLSRLEGLAAAAMQARGAGAAGGPGGASVAGGVGDAAPDAG
jgi:biopolymer transport protein ExbB